MADFECYPALWREPQIVDERDYLRSQLDMGKTVITTVCPGDGTRYQFLLVPYTGVLTPTIMNSCDPGIDQIDVALYVTVLNGMGIGTASINPKNDIDGIRHRIDDKMEIRNRCTSECLAQTVYALWSMAYVREG